MSKTILCADDSATMQKVAEITFAASDYTLVGAKSADEALQLAKGEKPVLILADAVMPGKTGYDLCKSVKADPSLADVPVVILCGNSQAYDEAKGAEVGADGHFTKPWDTQVMLDKVGEWLGGGAATSKPAPAAAATAKPAATVPAPAAKPAPAPAAAKPVPTPSFTPPAKAPAPVQPPRSATIMGMPAFAMPPGKDIPGVTSLTGGAAPSAPAAAPAPSASANGDGRAPMISSEPRRGLRLVPISEVAAQVAVEAGLDPAGAEMQALLKLSREVVERVVWEVVPDLAEAIIKHNLEKLTARPQ